MLSINTNLSSLIAQHSMKTSTNKLNQAIERMTTGFKINHAKDNAANYNIATNMTTKIGSLDVAADNVAMGMDLVTTASDTIALMQNKAERLRALCTQARNGTYGAQSLAAINTEANAILAEIDRIYSTAQYNGVALFTGGTESVAATPAIATFAMPRATSSGFIEEVVERDTSSMVTMTQLASGTTSATNEYSISTKEELVALANYVNNTANNTTGMTFVLGADIDLSSISNWTPIGDYSTNTSYQFKGTFDGNGHVIKNLTINNETKNYQGLFGYTATGSEIKNIGIEGGSVKGRNYVGGLVGESDSSSISNSYATGEVDGATQVGGLVGYSFSSSISNSYATGTVSGNSYLGGLAGQSYSTISNSYATGSVTGSGISVGGLMGESGSTISNSYATGQVTGSGNYVGGLVGKSVSSISNSAAVQSDSNAGVTVMTVEQIKSTSNLDSMGFTEANGWTIVNDMPILSWQREAQPVTPTPGGGAGGGSGAAGGGSGAAGVSSFTLQIGINGDSSCQIGFDTNFTYDLSAVGADIASDEALETIDDFLNMLSAKQTHLGAVQNRLESALDSIEVNMNNLTSSLSTIRDADIAEISSTYIQQQILQQASATLLATANQSPSIALQLI